MDALKEKGRSQIVIELKAHCPACRKRINIPEYRREKGRGYARTFAFCPACGAGLELSREQRWLGLVWPTMLLLQLFFVDEQLWPVLGRIAWAVAFSIAVAATFFVRRYSIARHPPRDELEEYPLTGLSISTREWVWIGIATVALAIVLSRIM